VEHLYRERQQRQEAGTLFFFSFLFVSVAARN